MPKFIIERSMPGAGGLTPDQLKNASQVSCAVLRSLGPDIQWIESFVTADKLYCIYLATDEELIREHAKLGGFPANSIQRVTGSIGPATAE